MTRATVVHRTAHSGPSRRKRHAPRFWVALAVLIGLFALVAVVVSRGSAPVEKREIADVVVEGAALPDLTRGRADAAVGMEAPAVKGMNFDGGPVTIPADGRPKAVILLAHWCSHCQAEVPRIQSWLDAGGAPAGVDLYSISTWADPDQVNWPPSAWLEREGWTLPVLVDDEAATAAGAFGLIGTPMWVFIDGEGKVVGRAEGEVGVDALDRILTALAE